MIVERYFEDYKLLICTPNFAIAEINFLNLAKIIHLHSLRQFQYFSSKCLLYTAHMKDNIIIYGLEKTSMYFILDKKKDIYVKKLPC